MYPKNHCQLRAPKGITGDKGDRGPQGVVGPIGENGNIIPGPSPTNLTMIDLFQIYNTYTGQFTVPSDKNIMFVTAVGGGGGGGGGYTRTITGLSISGGGGGGGSGFIFYPIPGVAGKTFNFTIGKGGTGGPVSGNGQSGRTSIISNSDIGVYLIAPGGQYGTFTDFGGNGGMGAGGIYPYPMGQAGGVPPYQGSMNGSGINNYSYFTIASGGGGGAGGILDSGGNVLGGIGGPSLCQIQPIIADTHNGTGGASFLGISAADSSLIPGIGAGGSGGYSVNGTTSLSGINGGDGAIYIYY